MKQTVKKREKSLYPTLFGLLSVLIACIVLFFALLTGQYAQETIRNASKASDNVLTICERNLDYILSTADTEMRTLLYHVDDLAKYVSDNENERYFATIRLINILEERIFVNQYIDIMLLMNRKQNLNICRAKSTKNLKDSSAFIAYGRTVDPGIRSAENQWRCATVNGTPYFIRVQNFGDVTQMGFIDATVLLRSMEQLDLKDGSSYVLVDENGEYLMGYPDSSRNRIAYPITEDLPVRLGERYSTISRSYEKIHARMYCVIEPWSWLNNNNVFVILSVVALVAAAGSVLLLYFYIRREISRPVRDMVSMTEHIRSGDLNYRVPLGCRNRELRSINDSMVCTVDELVRLRLSSYEHQIRLRDMELKYYRMQIRPHFFLNILTTIHSMNKNGQNERINPFVESLYDVIRYMFRSGLHTVPLQEEIEHLKQYTHMQSALHGKDLMLFYEIDDSLRDWPIPQMLLHTYVENIYKHTVSHGNMILARIQGFPEERNGETRAHIVIQDTGIGFSEEMLDYLNHRRTVNPKPDSIGLTNINASLNLMYGEDQLTRYSNIQPHGARVDLWIPERVQTAEEGEKTDEDPSGG